MGSYAEPVPQPWISTPCIPSRALSLATGCNIHLKLENLQPSGSFKSRGIGTLMLRALARAPPNTPVHFYSSSGGNAGLACATAALSLQRPATIAVPLSTTALVVGKLRALGAEVLQVGETWAHADKYLREEVLARDANGVYVPPFDHQDLWDGAGGIVEELEGQMEGVGGYDAVVCSVGGGGLMCGIVEGLERLGKSDIEVVATETEGAASLARSLEEGRHVTLLGITSIATSLGALRVADRTYELGKGDMVRSAVFTDAEAAMGCVWFADDERILVEAGCGVNLAACYTGRLREILGKNMSDQEWSRMRIVIVVCGGSNVTLEMLEGWREKFGDVVKRPDLAQIGGGEVKQVKKEEVVINGMEIKV